MAYDAQLAERIRATLKGRRGISEKKMFGGQSFLLRGWIEQGLAFARTLPSK